MHTCRCACSVLGVMRSTYVRAVSVFVVCVSVPDRLKEFARRFDVEHDSVRVSRPHRERLRLRRHRAVEDRQRRVQHLRVLKPQPHS